MDIDQGDRSKVRSGEQSLVADVSPGNVPRGVDVSKRWCLCDATELGTLDQHALQDLLNRRKLIAGARSLDFQGGTAHIGNRPYPKGDEDIKSEDYPNANEC